MNHIIERVETRVKNLREEAEKLTIRFTNDCSQINRDSNLSPEGKKRKIQEFRENAKDQLSQLRNKEDKFVEDEMNYLSKKLFGIDSVINTDVVSTRDAQDRARKIQEAHEAKDAYEQAKVTGDTILMKAIAHQAVNNNWNSIVDEHFGGKDSDAFRAYKWLVRLKENSLHTTMCYALWD